MTDTDSTSNIEESISFTDHYEIKSEHRGLIPTITQAREAADGNEKKIWFVREPDYDEPENADEEELYWSVESWSGQFVNCLGFFVTTGPCKPEHSDICFIY